jgi:hypothetical protein
LFLFCFLLHVQIAQATCLVACTFGASRWSLMRGCGRLVESGSVGSVSLRRGDSRVCSTSGTSRSSAAAGRATGSYNKREVSESEGQTRYLSEQVQNELPKTRSQEAPSLDCSKSLRRTYPSSQLVYDDSQRVYICL